MLIVADSTISDNAANAPGGNGGAIITSLGRPPSPTAQFLAIPQLKPGAFTTTPNL